VGVSDSKTLSNTTMELFDTVELVPELASRTTERRRIGHRRSWTLMLCTTALLLAACGGTGNEEDRRFANDPTQASQPTEVAVPTSSPGAATPVAELPPVDMLFRSRGAASSVYAIFNGNILVLRLDAPQAGPLEIAPPSGQAFAKVTSSPSGDRVGAMLVPLDSAGSPGTGGTLAVYDSQGGVLETWNDIVSFDPSGSTPAVAEGSRSSEPRIRMDWSSQGDQILITSGLNELVTVPLGGEPIPIVVPSGISFIEDARWSPRGDQIALLAKGGDGPTGVQLFTPNADPADLRQVIPPNEGTIPFPTIEQFGWLPDGSGIVYILADDQSGTPGDGQLFVLDLATETHRLIATPGQGGPSASIVTFSVSPDGKAVAYEIAIPDRGQWTFHSLWMRSLQDSRSVRLPVSGVIEVNAIWWTAQGLLWGQAEFTEDSGITETFVLQAPSSGPEELASIEVVPEGSARPQASPAATPIGRSAGNA